MQVDPPSDVWCDGVGGRGAAPAALLHSTEPAVGGGGLTFAPPALRTAGVRPHPRGVVKPLLHGALVLCHYN